MGHSATFIPAKKHYGGPLGEIVRLGPEASDTIKEHFNDKGIPFNQQLSVQGVEIFNPDTADNFGHKLHSWQDKGNFQKGQIIYRIEYDHQSVWLAEDDLELKITPP